MNSDFRSLYAILVHININVMLLAIKTEPEKPENLKKLK